MELRIYGASSSSTPHAAADLSNYATFGTSSRSAKWTALAPSRRSPGNAKKGNCCCRCGAAKTKSAPVDRFKEIRPSQGTPD